MNSARAGLVVAPGWFPRAVVSGFAASAVMLFGFIIAYGIAAVLAGIPLTERRGAEVMRSWLYALTHNSVIDFGLAYLYVAVAVYFAGGVLWAVLYARFADPYLPGPPWWRGVLFSLLPAAVSLFVVLPLLGGGLAGIALGAGPFPLIGNLLLHVLYGATLGIIYGPFGDLSAETLQTDTAEDLQAMVAAEQATVRAALIGLLVGLAIGLVGALGGLSQEATVLGVAPAAFLLATVLSGATLGALVGSLAGLPGPYREAA
jgi:hypothetical protein